MGNTSRTVLGHHPMEGVSKRYPEIGDRPKKVLSNRPKGSIEPLKMFYLTPRDVLKVL